MELALIFNVVLSFVGVNVNFENANKASALIAASNNGHLGVVQYLLRAGAIVDHEEADGWTAVMFASIRVIRK